MRKNFLDKTKARAEELMAARAGRATPFFPIYAGTMAIPTAYTISEQPYSLNSAWWWLETLQHMADKDYKKYTEVIRAERQSSCDELIVSERTTTPVLPAEALFRRAKPVLLFSSISKLLNENAP